MTLPKLTDTYNTSLRHFYLPLIYNSSSYLNSNNQLQQIHFFQEGERVNAHLAVGIDGELAISPIKAPFGGVEFSPHLTSEALIEWMKEVEQRLLAQGVNQLNLHQPPQAYQNQEVLNKALESLDYEVIQEHHVHVIHVNELSLADRMHDMEQRRLSKALKAGCEFKAYGEKDFQGVYNEIRRWRNQSNKPLSMEWDDLFDAKQRNPHAYLAFGVELKGRLIAATIAVKVNDQSLYHFFPASEELYKKYSPMVMLVNELYEWCKVNEIALLDLGTSYVKSQKKASLVQFKENLGAVPSVALSWRKTLS